jgi:hypothetical protein
MNLFCEHEAGYVSAKNPPGRRVAKHVFDVSARRQAAVSTDDYSEQELHVIYVARFDSPAEAENIKAADYLFDYNRRDTLPSVESDEGFLKLIWDI